MLHWKLSRGTEESQNITDICKNLNGICTNLNGIRKNITDILSLFCTFADFLLLLHGDCCALPPAICCRVRGGEWQRM